MQNHDEKIAFFDFCETLTDFQTADAYVDFVRDKIGSTRMKKMENIQKFLNRIKIINVLEFVTRYKYSLNKRIKLSQLKGIDKNTLEQLAHSFYEDRIKPHFINDLVQLLLKKKKDGWLIVLVSGGYSIYLQYFVMEFDVNGILSSRIGFNGNICTGRFDGMDCLNENKIKLLNKYFSRADIQECVAYSDSRSDIPFLSWVDQGYVVSREKHQSWVDKYNFKEIVWVQENQ